MLFICFFLTLFSKGSNECGFNSNLSKANIELKPINRSNIEYSNGENRELCKLLSEEKNGKLLIKNKKNRKKKKLENICEV